MIIIYLLCNRSELCCTLVTYNVYYFQVLEPPAEYLEEDLTSDDRVPPDALYMLHSIRVFGHFEKPVFLMLCKHTEILNLPAGSFLFKVGTLETD